MSLMTADAAADLLRPKDDGYDLAARVFYRAGRPALVVRPRNPDEIAAAVERAAADAVPLSVRSGGHSVLGHGTNTGGMVIDLARLDQIEILDAGRRLVRIGSGATWGSVAAALDAHDWGLTAGDTTNVGVGGLTLGGGIGWMVRKHGLAIDNLVAARIVTADGRLLTASVQEHPDLFWALRGGGGNFGVVVDFDFVAQPVTSVHFGSVAYRLGDPADLLGRWRDAMRVAPEELSSTVQLMPGMPASPPSATVLLCRAGGPGIAEADIDAAIEPLLELGTVTSATIRACRYHDILEHAAPPHGLRLAMRNTLLPRLDVEVVDAMIRLQAAPVLAAIEVRSLGGAFGRVPADATAFAHRDAEAMVACKLILPDTATDIDVDRALVPWHTVAAHGTGTYLNLQGSAEPSDLAAAYPPATYARLAAVKRVYDPDNMFASNHNVEPAL
jgi:FAD/FMN-containing dehydrogenase